MTNEELVRRYYGGDERALEELYRRNLGLIRRIARETAREFNCLHMDRERPGELSGYTKTILEDLCGAASRLRPYEIRSLEDRSFDTVW